MTALDYRIINSDSSIGPGMPVRQLGLDGRAAVEAGLKRLRLPALKDLRITLFYSPRKKPAAPSVTDVRYTANDKTAAVGLTLRPIPATDQPGWGDFRASYFEDVATLLKSAFETLGAR